MCSYKCRILSSGNRITMNYMLMYNRVSCISCDQTLKLLTHLLVGQLIKQYLDSSLIKVNISNWSAHRWSLNLVFTPITTTTPHHHPPPPPPTTRTLQLVKTTFVLLRPGNPITCSVYTYRQYTSQVSTTVQSYSCTVVKLYSHTVVVTFTITGNSFLHVPHVNFLKWRLGWLSVSFWPSYQ